MKQTALNWLIEKIHQANPSFKFDALIRQAKEMEKQQIIEAIIKGHTESLFGRVCDSEKYYNETFKSG